MPVYKDKNAKKNKWYYSFSYKESNKYKKKLKRGFKTKKEAENAMIEAMDSVNKGTYIEPSKTLYRDFMDSWLQDKKINVKKSTYSNYQYLVENFILVSLGDIELQKITPREIQTLYNNLKENKRLSSENIRKIHTIINDSLNKAFKWGMINRNPATLVDAPKVIKKEVEVWNQDEINIFLNVNQFHNCCF
ncbi:Arm DNA-binding domain-containing protein [Virgibacillus sp. Bac332]|uniref:Arm DNA-binding domain-containing protein n=1 Tax=Virgibacillus sp. Bac332 TaxID=2419842 RepID=UPI000EF52A99|nr:Arm DNA-binding domain-containing protein [Virgibacillus sp. Bac332]